MWGRPRLGHWMVAGLVLALLAGGFANRAMAEEVVLTLNLAAVPQGLECGQQWMDSGIEWSVGLAPREECAGVACGVLVHATRLDLLPGSLVADLSAIEGSVVSAEAILTAVCEDCASLILLAGGVEVAEATNRHAGFGIPTDTLSVAASGARVDRLIVQGCFETSVFGVRIMVDPRTVSIGPQETRIGAGMHVRPNPSSGAAEIGYSLSKPGRVTLWIHDLAGRNVRRLTQGDRGPGAGLAKWDGRDRNGRYVAPGVYLALLMVDGRMVDHARVVRLDRE